MCRLLDADKVEEATLSLSESRGDLEGDLVGERAGERAGERGDLVMSLYKLDTTRQCFMSNLISKVFRISRQNLLLNIFLNDLIHISLNMIILCFELTAWP